MPSKKVQSTNLNKKRIPFTEENEEEQEQNMYYESNMYSIPKKDGLLSKIKDYTKNNVSIDDFLQKMLPEQDISCAVCARQDFQLGRFLFQCMHNVCNECFKYWAEVKRQCPLCNTRVQEIVSILDGGFKQKQLKQINIVPQCQQCNLSINYNQMYFCDACNREAIHDYHPNRIDFQKEKWFCIRCKGVKTIKRNQADEQEYPYEYQPDYDYNDYDYADYGEADDEQDIKYFINADHQEQFDELEQNQAHQENSNSQSYYKPPKNQGKKQGSKKNKKGK